MPVGTKVAHEIGNRRCNGAMTYSPALDGLRALAIAAVFLFHARAPLSRGGYMGVDIFFVLSGFLITGLLLAEIDRRGKVDLRAFFLRRAVRLMPALALMLAVYLTFAPKLWPADSHSWQAASAITYLSGYAVAYSGQPPGQLSHTWSLAAEAHFYLLWPFVIVWGARRWSQRELFVALIALYLAASAWRLGCMGAGQSWQEVYYRSDTRMSGLLLGAAVAALVRVPLALEPLRRLAPLRLWMPLLLVALCTLQWGDPLSAAIGFTVAELACAAMLLHINTGSGALVRFLSRPAVVWIGSISYGIYLWHFPVLYFLRDEFSWTVAMVLGVPLSIGLAAASFYILETPLRRSVRRLSYKTMLAR